MADRRIYNLTDAGTLDGSEEIAVDALGNPEAQKTTTGALATLVGGTLSHSDLQDLAADDHGQYLTTGRADAWLGTKDTGDLSEGTNLYHTNARVDARIAAADAEDLANVAAGATEGEVLVSRTGVWTPEPLPGGGDMSTATYDPAGGARQVAFGDELDAYVPAAGAAGITRHVEVVTGASGTVTIDLPTAQVYDVRMTGATTLAFSNWPAAGTHAEALVHLTGNHGVTIPAAVVWDSGTAPTLTGGTDVLGFYSIDGGTVVVGTVITLGAA